MEVKKSPKADLRNWKGIFLEGGLIIALVVCIVAFSISQKDKVIVLQDTSKDTEEVEMIDVTQQQEEQIIEQPKEAVAVMADLFEMVKNDTQIDTKFEFLEFDENFTVPEITLGGEEIEEEEIFVIAEEMPGFQGGGLAEFRSWVNRNYEYPSLAADLGIEGTVVVNFVVEKDGSISNVKVMRSPDQLLSDEAIRTISSSPKWTPGKNRNIPVRITYTLNLVLRVN